MKWKLMAITIMCSIFFANATMAAWVNSGYVTKITSRDNGVQVIYVSSDIPDIGCTLSDRIALDPDLVGYKEILNSIQLARAAGWKLAFAIDQCLDFTLSDQNPEYHSGKTVPNVAHVVTYSE